MNLPESLQQLELEEMVDRVVEYQTPEADFSVITSDWGSVKNIRVFYLKNLREDWEWVDSSSKGVGFVMLKRRKN